MPGQPEDILMRRERAIMSRMLMQIQKLMHDTYFGTHERFGLTRDLQLVIKFVVLGQLEGRPFGLSKLANEIGVPRATLERRLTSLERRGLIVRRGRGFFVPVSKLNDPPLLQNLQRCVLMVHKASKELEKLPKVGTKTVDERGAVTVSAMSGVRHNKS